VRDIQRNPLDGSIVTESRSPRLRQDPVIPMGMTGSFSRAQSQAAQSLCFASQDSKAAQLSLPNQAMKPGVLIPMCRHQYPLLVSIVGERGRTNPSSPRRPGSRGNPAIPDHRSPTLWPRTSRARASRIAWGFWPPHPPARPMQKMKPGLTGPRTGASVGTTALWWNVARTPSPRHLDSNLK
jgi:hypothetical protein